MSLPRTLFSPAFRARHLGRSFAVIVGIMVFIATFATAAETSLLTLGYDWGKTMESRITVEIPAVGDESGTSQADRVQKAIAILRATPEAGLVIPLSDSEVAGLLQPWFSEQDLLKTLPLPTLIDVIRKPGATLTADQIQDRLRSVVSDAHVDDHGAWLQDAWRLEHGLALVGGMMIVLTAITLFIAVTLLCRTVTASEHETIGLLHLLGARDRDIARHFQSQAERLAWRAAAAGFVIALAVTAALMYCTRHIVDFSTLTPLRWGLLAALVSLVPVGAIGIAAVTARLSVMRHLESLS